METKQKDARRERTEAREAKADLLYLVRRWATKRRPRVRGSVSWVHRIDADGSERWEAR
jgi:hypothetical protein